MSNKTAPDPKMLAEYAELYDLLAPDCNNCSLPPLNFQNAIVAEHMKSAIFNVMRECEVVEKAAELGLYIRWGFTKYREVARVPRFRASVARKVH